jgi:hypothetical protein
MFLARERDFLTVTDFVGGVGTMLT